MLDYDTIIPRLCPGYERALEQFSARAKNAKNIIELGVGTGNIARAILLRNPSATYLGIDADESMLAVARKKLEGYAVALECADFSHSNLGHVDAVISSLSIHHLDPPQQVELLKRAYSAGKIFLHFELIAPETDSEKRTYADFLEEHVRKQAADLGLDAALLRSLKEQSERKDKPMKFSEHECIFNELGARVEKVFQEHCFVFYECSKP